VGTFRDINIEDAALLESEIFAGPFLMPADGETIDVLESGTEALV